MTKVLKEEEINLFATGEQNAAKGLNTESTYK